MDSGASNPPDGPDISRNRSACKYTRAEQVRRVLWMAGQVLFRLSPRPCFSFRRWLLRRFGAVVGREVNLYPSTHIYFPWNFEIGNWSSVGEWALIYNLGRVTIGKKVTISQRAHLCAGTHDFRDPAMPLIKSSITVKDGVWICADAFVGPGVIIETGAVLGARAVVVRDVGAGLIMAGNPVHCIGKR